MQTLAEAEAYVSALGPREKADLDALLGSELDTQRVLNRLRDQRHWSPRSYQSSIWDYLQAGGKRACVIWHRRSGKDDVALNWAAEAAIKRVGEYWHMLPEAAQGRKVVWDAVNPHTGKKRIDQAFPEYMRSRKREQDMALEFSNGSLWRVVGSDNYNSLVGATPAGVVFSEWALADPNAWSFLRPILMENGGWAIFITTPRGLNHAKTTYDLARSENDWFAELLTADDTGVFTKAELARELRELQHDMGPEEGQAQFDQEYNCSFQAALIGAYYGAALSRAEKEGRIGKVSFDRGALVHTAWDLGVSDSTAIWFVQCVGKERRLLDYVEVSGVGFEEHARILTDKAKAHGITYGYHFFPHDIQDRELSNNGLSRAVTLQGLGIKPKLVPASNVNDGINAVRRMLDFAWIDEKRCERGLNTLRNYQRGWSEKLKMFSDAPLHNWASHGADALRTFACGYRDPKDKSVKIGAIPTFRDVGRQAGSGWMAR